MLIGFYELFFHKKNRAKNRTGSTVFSLSERGTPVPLLKSQPCLSWKKKTENTFFPFQKRHARDSRESTTVPLAKAKPCLSRKKKKRKRVFFPFRKRHARASRESTTVPLTKKITFFCAKENSKFFFGRKAREDR